MHEKSNADFSYKAVWHGLEEVNVFVHKWLEEGPPEYRTSEKIRELTKALTAEFKSEYQRIFGVEIETVIAEEQKRREEQRHRDWLASLD